MNFPARNPPAAGPGGLRWRKSGLVALAFTAAFLVDTLVRLGLGQPVASNNFCAEQGNVAAALVHGAGFADALGTHSGPTAWVPPVFPVYLAAVFLLFGVKTAAALKALLVLDSLLAGSCVLALLLILDLAGFPRLKPLLAALVFTLILIDQEGSMGLWFSTTWFVAALGSWVLLSAVCLGRGLPGWTPPLALGVSLAVLTHAGLGLAAVVAVMIVWAKTATERLRSGLSLREAGLGSARGPAIVLGCAALSVGAWTVRNALVFKRFIPLKSTGWYETWLAAAYTTTGVIDDSVMMAHSPFSNPSLLSQYTAEGEPAYLGSFRQRVGALFARSPGLYAAGVRGRMRNIFLICDTSPHAVAASALIPAGDVARICDAGLGVSVGNPGTLFWTCIDLSPEEFEKRESALALTRPQSVLGDWIRAKRHRLDTQGSPLRLLSELSLSFLPTSCLLVMFLAWRERIPFEFALAGAFYVCALLPNILITHYSLHSLHFIGLHALIAIGAVAAWRRAPASYRG